MPVSLKTLYCVLVCCWAFAQNIIALATDKQALTSTDTSTTALLLLGSVSRLLVVTAAMLGCTPPVVALVVRVTSLTSPGASSGQMQVMPDSSFLQTVATEIAEVHRHRREKERES
jgi:hypothetical protein